MSQDINVGQISEALNNKADTTLTNINASASAKETIVNWGMPDYTAGVSYSHNVWTQAPYDCYVTAGSASGSNLETGLYQNTTNSDTGMSLIGYIYGYSCCFGSFMPKGMWFKCWTNSSYPAYLTYYPLKGEI